MSQPQSQLPEMLNAGEGASRRRIAFLNEPARTPGRPTLIWLAGLMSDMVSTKAEALSVWAREHDVGMTRFDYSGHGRSEGVFEDANISDWLEEALQVFMRVTSGPVLLVGSSTGGYVALLMLQHLMKTNPSEAARIAALVLIAPAWDLTEDLMWKAFPTEVRDEIMTQGRWVRPSAYGPDGYAITRQFIEDGRMNLLQRFDPCRPVSILQGLQDTDVPAAHTRRLLTHLMGDWVRIDEVLDGGHRLSRPQDLERLYGLIDDQLRHIDDRPKSAAELQ